MNKYNIAKPEKYTKDGVEKTYWVKVGTLVEFQKPDGTVSRIIEIPTIGLKANAFPVEPKIETVAPQAQPEVKEAATVGNTTIPYPTDEINADDIPF